MNNNGNYIKISRSILEWEWYKNLNTKVLFLHCLLKANWREGKFEGTTVPRGSFVTSIRKLSLELALTDDEVRTALGHLIKTGELTKQTTNKYTVITVSNYDLYQDITKQIPNKSQTDTEQLPNKSQSIPKPFPTIEEGKKEKKEEDNYTVSKDTVRQTEVRRVVEEWNKLGVNTVRKMSESSTRYKMISARIKEYGVEDVIKAVRKVKESDFLRGGGKRGWMIDFEWFARPNNFIKVYEGKYDNKDSNRNSELEDWVNE